MKHIALAVLISVIGVTDSEGRTVSAGDIQTIRSLLAEGQMLESDLLETGHALTDAASANPGQYNQPSTMTVSLCLVRIGTGAENLDHELLRLSTSALIASRMVSAEDEAFANSITATVASELLRVDEIVRSIGNTVAGACGSSALITAKTQDIIHFANKVSDTIKPLAKRLGAKEN